VANEPVKVKSVRDTYLYTQINKGGNFDNNIKTLLSKGITPTAKQLERQISTINSYYKFSLKTVVLDALKRGDVVPMMFPKGITAQHKIPTCLPFILVPGGTSGIRAVAIIDNYASMDKDTALVDVDTQKFYTFLETAFVARAIQIGFKNIRSHAAMYTNGSSIYAHMFTRLLNKKYALNINKSAYQKIIFLSSKFFMRNVLQLPDSAMVNNYAMRDAKEIDKMSINRLEEALMSSTEGHAYDDIAQFIKGLSGCGHLVTNGFNQLEVRGYMTDFIRMYGNSALFGLEHISYFLFNIFSTMNSAFLNNQYAFKDIIGKSGSDLYGYICNAVKNY
jgi:hypothetical protein